MSYEMTEIEWLEFHRSKEAREIKAKFCYHRKKHNQLLGYPGQDEAAFFHYKMMFLIHQKHPRLIEYCYPGSITLTEETFYNFNEYSAWVEFDWHLRHSEHDSIEFIGSAAYFVLIIEKYGYSNAILLKTALRILRDFPQVEKFIEKGFDVSHIKKFSFLISRDDKHEYPFYTKQYDDMMLIY